MFWILLLGSKNIWMVENEGENEKCGGGRWWRWLEDDWKRNVCRYGMMNCWFWSDIIFCKQCSQNGSDIDEEAME